MPRGISAYTAGRRAPSGSPLAAPTSTAGRGLSYERVLEDEGVERDPATGIPFRWVDEAAPSGARRRRKHFVAMSAEEAQNNSRPGQCWDFYIVGVQCKQQPTPCDRPMSGWTHRGRKFVPEHHHVIDVPRDEVWEEADDEAAVVAQEG